MALDGLFWYRFVSFKTDGKGAFLGKEEALAKGRPRLVGKRRVDDGHTNSDYTMLSRIRFHGPEESNLEIDVPEVLVAGQLRMYAEVIILLPEMRERNNQDPWLKQRRVD
jgi:hypothetical protein